MNKGEIVARRIHIRYDAYVAYCARMSAATEEDQIALLQIGNVGDGCSLRKL